MSLNLFSSTVYYTISYYTISSKFRG